MIFNLIMTYIVCLAVILKKKKRKICCVHNKAVTLTLNKFTVMF